MALGKSFNLPLPLSINEQKWTLMKKGHTFCSVKVVVPVGLSTPHGVDMVNMIFSKSSVQGILWRHESQLGQKCGIINMSYNCFLRVTSCFILLFAPYREAICYLRYCSLQFL